MQIAYITKCMNKHSMISHRSFSGTPIKIEFPVYKLYQNHDICQTNSLRIVTVDLAYKRTTRVPVCAVDFRTLIINATFFHYRISYSSKEIIFIIKISNIFYIYYLHFQKSNR